MKSGSKSRFWSWLLAGPLALFLLYWSLRGVDWRSVGGTLGGANWALLASSSFITGFSFFQRSVRWRILLTVEERLSVGTVFCATMAGYMGNAFLPARAGELVRTLVISARSSLTRTYVLTTALSERLMDVIALVLWASLILLGVHPKPEWIGGVARAMAAAAVLGATAIAVLPHTGALCERVARALPLPDALRGRLLTFVSQVLLGMRAFHHVGRLLGFAGLTVTIWVTDALGTMVAAHALGLTISFSTAMLLLTGLGLSSALPSTPGYVGIFQFVAVTILVPFGIPKSQAIAFIFMIQACGYVSVLAMGLPCFYILRTRMGVAMDSSRAA